MAWTYQRPGCRECASTRPPDTTATAAAAAAPLRTHAQHLGWPALDCLDEDQSWGEGLLLRCHGEDRPGQGPRLRGRSRPPALPARCAAPPGMPAYAPTGHPPPPAVLQLLLHMPVASWALHPPPLAVLLLLLHTPVASWALHPPPLAVLLLLLHTPAVSWAL
jgi:hypothetical protein